MNDTDDSVNDIYRDGSYAAAHPDWHNERATWKAEQVLIGISASRLLPRSICDVGCGTGLVLSEVVDRLGGVERAVGFEPSPDAPPHPRAQGLLDIRRHDAYRSDEEFDLCLMLDVFEHVSDDIGFVRSCAALAPVHIFHIPLDAHALGIVRHGLIRTRYTLGHLHYYSRLTALATLTDAGYEALHWHFTPAGWEGEGRDPWKLINVVRRLVYRISPEFASRLLGGVSLLVVARAGRHS